MYMTELIGEMKRKITEKRLELKKLEAALNVLTSQTPFELKHPTGKETKKPKPRSKQRRYRRKRIVMAAGHYEAIIGAMLHADAGQEFSAKDVVKYARGRGSHATKSAVHAILIQMAADGWLERRGKRVRESLYRRAMMDPARWSTLYKAEEGGSRT